MAPSRDRAVEDGRASERRTSAHAAASRLWGLASYEGFTKRLAKRTRELTLDDVVDLEHLWLTSELDSALGENRHQAFTESLELLF
jgi:hypothetical protein